MPFWNGIVGSRASLTYLFGLPSTNDPYQWSEADARVAGHGSVVTCYSTSHSRQLSSSTTRYCLSKHSELKWAISSLRRRVKSGFIFDGLESFCWAIEEEETKLKGVSTGEYNQDQHNKCGHEHHNHHLPQQQQLQEEQLQQRNHHHNHHAWGWQNQPPPQGLENGMEKVEEKKCNLNLIVGYLFSSVSVVLWKYFNKNSPLFFYKQFSKRSRPCLPAVVRATSCTKLPLSSSYSPAKQHMCRVTCWLLFTEVFSLRSLIVFRRRGYKYSFNLSQIQFKVLHVVNGYYSMAIYTWNQVSKCRCILRDVSAWDNFH